MAKRLNVDLAFTANTSQAKAQLQDLQNQLTQLTMTANSGNKLGLTKDIAEATSKVAELQSILQSATTSTGKLDLGAFTQGIKKSGTDLKEYARILNSLGPEGSQAFASLARSITTAEIPLRKVNGLLSEMWTTMKNTARWQLTSSVLHGFIGGLQSAVGYAKDLNKTLTDIRIVAPEKSMEDMARFSKIANKQAKELSSTTLDYAKAALIYYQQGEEQLGGEQAVLERTDVTTKMANVTGDSVDEVSSYMTAIWNNFNKAGDESAEHFADILTKLGAETAASTTEITDAIEKYSAVADTIGLSYEAATAAATTLIDRTREAPEVAGTALKTVFARLEGLKVEGSTDEGGVTTTFNKYSQTLKAFGIDIKDANGELKAADDILDEVGHKWKDLQRDQQVALAQNVAGIRQWNQFAALMDNYDYFEKYKQMAEAGSEGALQEQQEIYAESWEAARDRVTTAIQSIYMQLLDDKFFIKTLNVIAEVVDGINKMIEGMGGLKAILPLVGTLMLKAFGNNIARSMDNIVYNLKMQGKGYDEIIKQRKVANEALKDTLINYGNQGVVGGAQLSAYEKQSNVQSALIAKQEKLNSLNKSLTAEESKQAELLLDIVSNRGQDIIKLSEELEQNQKNSAELQKQVQTSMEVYQQRNKQAPQYQRVTTERTGQGLQNVYHSFEDDIAELKILEEESNFAYQAWERFGNEFRKNLESGNDEELRKIEIELKAYMAALEESGVASEECISYMSQLFNDILKGNTTAEGIEQIDAAIHDLQIDAEMLYQDIEGELNKAFAESPKLLQEFQVKLQQLKESFQAGAISEEEFTQKAKELRIAAEGAENIINKFKGTIPTASDGMVALASSAMQVSMALTMIRNLDDIWKNDELSNGEKMFETFTNLAMILPIVTSLINKNNIANLATLPASISASMGYMTQAEAETLLAGANESLAASFKALWISMAPLLPFLIIGATAIAGIVVAARSGYKEMHKFEEEFEHAKDTAKEASAVYDEVSTQINTVKNNLDALQSKKTALEELTEGTEEWKEALNEVSKAEADVKTEIEKLADSSQVKDFFTSIARVKHIQNVYDENGKIIDTVQRQTGQLMEGVDYVRDIHTGAIELTDAGKQWAEILQQIAETQAKITNDAAQMHEKFTELSASTEKIRNQFGSFQNSDKIVSLDPTTQGLINSYLSSGNQGTSKELTMSTIEQISTLLATDRLTEKDFGLDAESFAEKAGISQNLAELIQSDEKLTLALLQNGELVRANTESMSQMATDDLLQINKDDKNGLYERVYGEDSQIKEKYRSGFVDYMGEEVTKQTNRGISDEDWKDNETLYKESYAAKNNLTYDAKKDKFKDSEGNVKDITDADVKSVEAYDQALKRVTEDFDTYKKILKDTQRDNKRLEHVKNIWKEQSSAIKEASKEINKHGKQWKELDKTLTQGIENTVSLIKDDLIEALDLTDLSKEGQDSILNGEFVSKNAEDIEAALNGDVDALNRLQAAAAEEYVVNIATNNGTFDQMSEKINSLNKEISSLNQDIEVNAILNGKDEFVQKCQEMVNTAGMTADQARDYFASMGYDVEFESDEEEPATYTQYQPQIRLTTKTLPFKVPRLSLSGMLDGVGGDEAISWQDVSFKVPDISFKGYDYSSSQSGGAKATALKIKTLKKVNGGNISGKNKTSVNRAGKPPRSSGKGSGGSGGKKDSGGSSSAPARSRKGYEKSTLIERYKEITDKINLNQKSTERLAKLQEKLYGKDRLSKMDQVNKKHLNEIKLLRAKVKEAKNYLREDKAMVGQRFQEAAKIAKNALKKESKRFNTKDGKQLKKVINSLGKNFSYDSDGKITNYTKVMQALQDELNFYESVYNEPKNFNNEEAQNKYKEKYITPLSDAINRLQSAIDQYDQTRELIEELKDSINDAYTEWQDLNYDKLTYSLEIKVTVNDNDLNYLNHKLSQVEDDIYKAAEVLDYYFSGSGDTKLKLINEAITIQTNNFKNLDKAYQDGKITQEQYVEGLQESYSALLSNVESISNLKKELTDYYSNVLNNVISEMDKYISRVEHMNSLTDHYRKILDLTGRGKDYNLLEQLYAANATTATTLVNMHKAEYETAQNEANNYLKAYEEIKKKIDDRKAEVGDIKNDKTMQNLEDEAEVMRKAYEAALETAHSAEDQMFSSVQDALDNAASALETSLERAAKAVEKALTGIVGSFEELARQMNMTSTRQDEYLTKTNQSYELNKMQRTLAKDMDKTDSKAAKTRLANFSKELKALEEKDELSNLELEIAKRKYELLKAQIALEDSQNAKSVIRLSRDNEGNYGYVYVANEEETEDAEQAVEDAKNDLYNYQLEATNNYGQKYTQAVQEYQNALQEFMTSDEYKSMTDEERNYRIAKIQEQHEALIGSYGDLYKTGYSATDFLVEPLQNDAWVYRDYNNNIELMNNNLGAFNTEIESANQALSVWKTQVENITKYVNFEERMNDVVTTTEETMNQLSKQFEETGEQVTKVLNDVGKKIADFVETTIPQMNKWISNTDSIVEQIKNIIENATNGKIDRATENLNEFLVKWGGENSNYKYTNNHIAYNDTTKSIGLSSNAENWSADVIAKNEVTAKNLLTAFESGQSGYFGFTSGGLLSYITGVTSTSDKAYKNWVKKVKGAKAFDTGGYTGEWTQDGKIAILHEKELVLNETDTQNILNAVSIIRDKNFLSSLNSPSLSWNAENQQLEQNVKIEAQFPNVTDRYEIEQAFSNLVNRASQHAFNNRK